MIAFSPCPAERVPAVLKFFADMYSPEYILARDEAFFNWQYATLSQGGTGHLTLTLALVDDQIAGCVGFIPVEARVAGRTVRAAWAANWMVDQKYRRLGLGPLLIRHLADQFDVTLALGGNRDAHDLLPRMGWNDFGDLPRYVCVIDCAAAAALTETGSLAWPEALRQKALESGQGNGIRRVDGFSDSATKLWDRDYAGVGGTRRSAAFLNWRYATHPVFEYRLFEAYTAGRLEGFAVYRIEQVRDLPVRIGRLVELVGDDRYALALLRAILRDGRAHGVSVFDFFCSSARVRPVMGEAGFVNGREDPASAIPMLFQPLDRGRTGILFVAHVRKLLPGARECFDWYVTSADGDQDRPT